MAGAAQLFESQGDIPILLLTESREGKVAKRMAPPLPLRRKTRLLTFDYPSQLDLIMSDPKRRRSTAMRHGLVGCVYVQNRGRYLEKRTASDLRAS